MVREINKKDFEKLMLLYTQLHNNPKSDKGDDIDNLWNRIVNDKDHHILDEVKSKVRIIDATRSTGKVSERDFSVQELFEEEYEVYRKNKNSI